MSGTGRGKRTATRGRWCGMGGVLVGAAMCAGVAFAVAPEPVRAQEGTIRTAPVSGAGSIQRTGGLYTAPNVTAAAATYVIVAPGGVLLGADYTPVANVTPVTYVNGVVSGPSTGPAPAQTISTPTAVPNNFAGVPAGSAGGITPGQHLIGSMDGPTNGGVPGLPAPVISGQFVTMPAPVQAISTPTAVTGVAPAPFGSNGVTAIPPFVQRISTPTAVTGVAPAAFSGTGATAVPPFPQAISTPTGVSVPASFAGAAGFAGGDTTNTLASTPGSTNAVSGITYPSRGSTP